MHMGTNIVLIMTCFVFCWYGFGCCAFLIGDRNMHTSQFGLFGFLGIEAKIGTAVIPRHLIAKIG